MGRPTQLRRFAIVALMLAACSPIAGTRPATAPSSAPEGGPARGVLPLCTDVPLISAPAHAYRDTPVYVGNEMPEDEILAWAIGQPGFEEIWIDRSHNGWVTVAFSKDAAARQRDLNDTFPGVGVVAVQVDWTSEQLDALQAGLPKEFYDGSGTLPMQGKVSVFVGALTPEHIAEADSALAGEPVCLEGLDPATVPEPGPQQPGGIGWRLLATEPTGHPYRTGIAWDEGSLRDLWATAGITAPIPRVDFARDVVVWFGAVHGSSCPELRLDDVVVDSGRGLVHGTLVNPSAVGGCTADAVPRAFLIAVERVRLPAPPFWIQLSDTQPPAGAPEERTIVEADLRGPRSVAAQGQVHGDPALFLPGTSAVESGAIVEVGFPFDYLVRTRCGVEWLGRLNEVMWRASSSDAGPDWIPEAWQPAILPGDVLVVSGLMEPGPEPSLTATANGHAEVYVPSSDTPHTCA